MREWNAIDSNLSFSFTAKACSGNTSFAAFSTHDGYFQVTAEPVSTCLHGTNTHRQRHVEPGSFEQCSKTSWKAILLTGLYRFAFSQIENSFKQRVNAGDSDHLGLSIVNIHKLLRVCPGSRRSWTCPPHTLHASWPDIALEATWLHRICSGAEGHTRFRMPPLPSLSPAYLSVLRLWTLNRMRCLGGLGWHQFCTVEYLESTRASRTSKYNERRYRIMLLCKDIEWSTWSQRPWQHEVQPQLPHQKRVLCCNIRAVTKLGCYAKANFRLNFWIQFLTLWELDMQLLGVKHRRLTHRSDEHDSQLAFKTTKEYKGWLRYGRCILPDMTRNSPHLQWAKFVQTVQTPHRRLWRHLSTGNQKRNNLTTIDCKHQYATAKHTSATITLFSIWMRERRQ